MEMPISIFPLFLLVGVTLAFLGNIPLRNYGDNTVFQPILTRSQARRICVELCLSGLGGKPCGDDCVDLSPISMPLQPDADSNEEQNTTKVIGRPRSESCPVLCENNLGYPLCNCKSNVQKNEVDYVQICGHFCMNFNYRIFGCQECEVYKKIYFSNSSIFDGVKSFPPIDVVLASNSLSPFWIQWCVKKCAEGEGGSACNCDKPVMIRLY